MAKNVLLKLFSVRYAGDSIGNDIRIEIETIGISFGFDKKIKNGTISQINKIIGGFSFDRRNLILPVTFRMIEKDPLFNDVGIKKTEIKVDLSISAPQRSTHRIEVPESRRTTRKSKAIFDVTLEISVADAVCYIDEQEDGFLLVKMEDGSEEGLPSYLKVLFRYTEDDRDHFTILEGILQGRKASAKLKGDGKSHLLSGDFHADPVRMTYSLSKKKLRIKGKRYQVVASDLYPWKKGFYDVEIPDHPHGLGRPYLDKAKKALVWFHIGHDYREERYLHTGRLTEGCMTVEEVEHWDEIYDLLIRARKRDSKSVGILEVID